MTTILEMVQDAAEELSVPRPIQLFGSGDEDSRLWISLSNRESNQFSQMASNKGGWQNLHKEHNFQTVVTTDTGTTTSGSKVITGLSDTSDLTEKCFMVSGTGVPYQAIIQTVDSSTQVTLDRPCTASGSVSLTFAQFAYDMPSDFEYFIDRTFWDGAYQWQLLGPILAQEKQVLRYGISPAGPRKRFYIKQNRLCLDPMPSVDGETIAFDYYSNAWCHDENDTDQSSWQSDSDQYKLDEDCFILGLKWRYLRSKGFDYAQEYKDYEDACQRVMGRDGGSRCLPLNASGGRNRLIDSTNIPDTGYGQ